MARSKDGGTLSGTHVPFPEYPNVIAIFEGDGIGPGGTKKHSHPWAEINIMIEGKSTWITEEGALDVRPGDGFLLMPQTPHHSKWVPGVAFKAGTVCFQAGLENEALFNMLNSGEQTGPPRAGVSVWLWEALAREPVHRLNWKGLPEWWRRIYDETDAASGPYRALRVESDILEMLSRFADPSIGKPHWEQGDRRGIERALRHISETMDQGSVSVAELARIAGMSRSKFAELFHRTLGMPPHAYATALRMWMAQSSLVGNRVPAAVIADDLGFSSPQHFSRAFKRVTGMTPKEYRRRWAAPWLKQD